jgi:hypothetical protein
MSPRFQLISTHRIFALLVAGSLLATASGCAKSYVTPGRGISLQAIVSTDADIADRMARTPAARLPATIATVRVQDSGYSSYRTQGYGKGNYCVVTARDVEQDADFDRLEKMPQVAAIVRLNRLVIPEELKSDKELRLAAASLHADVLLAYSFDTIFRLNERPIGPFGVITLGMLPIDEAVVTTTASAALFDVRSGFVYGLAESTAQEKQLASAWTNGDAADEARIRAERKAFSDLLTEVERTWGGAAGRLIAAK